MSPGLVTVDHYAKVRQDDGATMALQPMDRVIRNPKLWVPVAPQNGDGHHQRFEKKRKDCYYIFDEQTASYVILKVKRTIMCHHLIMSVCTLTMATCK